MGKVYQPLSALLKPLDTMTSRELRTELRQYGRTFDPLTDTISLRDWLLEERALHQQKLLAEAPHG